MISQTDSSATRSTPFAAFSADVEDYFQVEALRHLCPPSRWTSFEDRTRASTERLLALLDRSGARGTFFVLGWAAERHPDLVRRIAAAGHEVASHGYAHELVTKQNPDTFREDIRRARGLLEDLSGQKIVGYRAPSYTVVDKTRWALSILAEEGYEYDSSIFPIRRRRYGMPGAYRWPSRLRLPDERSIVEFPLPTVRYGVFNLPATGGAYLRLLPFSLQKWAVSRMLRHRQPFALSVHPWELDPLQPRFPVGLRTRWTHYHNLDKTEDRLGTLLSLGEYRPLIEVLRELQLVNDTQP